MDKKHIRIARKLRKELIPAEKLMWQHLRRRQLKLKQIARSEVITVYECPKCHARAEAKGKCETCKVQMVEKKTCRDSGSFPFVKE